MNVKISMLVFMFSIIISTSYSQQVVKAKPGPAGSWQIIGHTEANFNTDHDVIMVVGPFDNFRKIKFKVTNAPLNLQRLQITYENGQTEKVPTRYKIPQGGESRIIDLPGGSRRIRRIDFWYDTAGILKGKAKVTLFGIK